jgi:hypothetical protein
MTTVTKIEHTEALERLREWLKPGDTVHTILRHVSRSGMQRVIQLVRIEPGETSHEARVLHIGWSAARALGMRYDNKREGIVVGGCGMDMGFALVYELSRVLWPNGHGCTGVGCPSNDHSNGDRDYTPHNAALVAELERNRVSTAIAANHWHTDGGYTLKQRWL